MIDFSQFDNLISLTAYFCTEEKCQAVERGSVAEIEFKSAGTQSITIRLRSGNTTTQQVLTLEVR